MRFVAAGLCTVALVAAIRSPTFAQEPRYYPPFATGHTPRPIDCSFFPRGSCTLQLMGGAFFSPVADIGPGDTPYNFAPLNIRLGKTMAFPRRGSLEPMLGLTTAGVFAGPGTVHVGPSLLLRYNLARPGCRLVPYWQIGAGLMYSDAYKDPTQRMLGQGLEFDLQGGIGARFLLKPHVSFDVEWDHHHFSNGGMAERNLGVNAFGLNVGFTFYFPMPH